MATMVIFLPLLTIEASGKIENLDRALVPLLAGGAAMAGLTYVFAHFVESKRQRLQKGFDLAAATFGGGNRGVTLIIVLLAGMSAWGLIDDTEADIYLVYFFAIDLGNFAFLLLVLLPVMVTRRCGRQPHIETASEATATGRFLREMGLPVVFIAIGVVAYRTIGLDAQSAVDRLFFEPTTDVRRTLLLFLSTLAVFLNMRWKEIGLVEAIDLVLTIYLTRLIAIGISVLSVGGLLTWIGTGGDQTIPLFTALSLAAGVLMICPPSSMLFPAIPESEHELADGVATAAGLLQLLYIVLLILALLFLLLGGVLAPRF